MIFNNIFDPEPKSNLRDLFWPDQSQSSVTGSSLTWEQITRPGWMNWVRITVCFWWKMKQSTNIHQKAQFYMHPSSEIILVLHTIICDRLNTASLTAWHWFSGAVSRATIYETNYMIIYVSLPVIGQAGCIAFSIGRNNNRLILECLAFNSEHRS